jgi:YegS/Rv2252/BmrU family lipid kinase
MRKKKLLFVFNPYSGKGLIKNKLADIVDTFVKNDYEVTIHPTQAPQDARNLVSHKAGKYDLVVCSGGDGTLDEVVSGMMKREEKKPIGYIPAGSTNDFANSLKLPKDMIKAAKAAVSGRCFPCDVGNMNEKYFVYVAAFGLFTRVSYGTPQEWKNLLGHAAYILEGAKSLHTIKEYPMHVECNGDVIDGDFIFGMVTNSISVGGFKNMTGPNVELDDGLFEVTLIKNPKNPVELHEILRSLTNLKDDTDMIYSCKTNEIRIVAEEDVAWTMDGEFGGDHREVLIRNEKQAVTIMVDEEAIG